MKKMPCIGRHWTALQVVLGSLILNIDQRGMFMDLARII